MSYNIDHVETKVLDAWIRAADVLALLDDEDVETPESCFLDGMRPAAEKAEGEHDPDRRIPLPAFWWCGECSGTAYNDGTLDVVVEKIGGTVEAILFWEGGESVTGLLVKDGERVECEVEMRLVKPAGW